MVKTKFKKAVSLMLAAVMSLIIKHTDNGETQIETPENGATFEIYLKSSGSFDSAEEDERDVIVCDENGFGQTKDMPYGVYTVHQTSGWEGRELMDDFDVFIAQDGQTYRYLINNANFESYRSCPACSVFCCRCGSHLRKFYRCKETGTRIKAVYPLCHCQRCDYLRAGAYACCLRLCGGTTRYRACKELQSKGF